ncbi:MAG: guanylate kinase [Candidatus Omnitrophota bacterium]
MIFVVSAASGTGKTTILKILAQRYKITRFTTSTTRPPRRSEKNRQDYYFHTEPEFQNLIESNGLAEWAVVYGFHYGTPRAKLEASLKKNRPIVLALDTQGAARIKSQYPKQTVLIALLPPSRKELENRIRYRQKETGENDLDVKKRLSEAKKELKILAGYDYRIVNETPGKTAELLYQIIQTRMFGS